ncbi:MAG: hypothetical protein MK226_01485 [Saprospiraceae bacterium]|nr:hypothetical protein [Saprospiraceae bacterium]
MINWKTSVLDLIKSLILYSLLICFGISLPFSISKGCGPYDLGFRGYSFIYPEIIDLKAEGAPFFLSFKEISDHYKGPVQEQITGNLEEWQERFCEVATIEDIGEIVYKADADDIRLLRNTLSSESSSAPYGMKGNKFVSHLIRNKCFETVDYLYFAKRCEPHVTDDSDPWEEPIPRDKEKMQSLIDEGKRTFRQTASHYFRLRYAYQLIRLAHYMKDYQQALDLYDDLLPKTDNDPSILDYWILGHKAGALMGMGENVEASYLFAIIFDQCPSKRTSAFRSFNIHSDEEWKACLLRCETERQQAVMHALRANASHANRLEEMQAIYDLDPNNEYLPLLLIKEIQELEKDLLGYGFNDQNAHNKRYHKRPRPEAGKNIIDIQKFVREIVNDNRIEDLGLWVITEGYLEFLAGNEYFAQRTFKKAQKMVKKPALKEQLKVWELALQISSYQTITEDIEKRLSDIERLNPLFEKYQDFEDFTNDKLATLYRQEQKPGKAFLTHYPVQAMLPNPSMVMIDDLIGVCLKPSRNFIERRMVEKGDSTILHDLQDVKSVYYLARSKLEIAREAYQDIPRPDWDDYGLYAPYVERINDCVHCRLPDSTLTYNRGELIEDLRKKEYEARAETDIEKAAYRYYQLGLAFYNMTYFGPTWKATDFFRSGSSMDKYELLRAKEQEGVFDHYYYPLGNRENMDCSEAKRHFLKVIELSSNQELLARALFMAAKCEQNEYYVNRFNGASRTYEYFDLLMGYTDTRFGQRLIKECKYFEAYVNR